MAHIFRPSSNALSRASLVGALVLAAGAIGTPMLIDRAGFNQRKGTTLEQPVPFSHEHHVAGLGIDCRYCHTSVEKAAVAGIPPTATCYNCHKIVWNQAPMLEPVRSSFRTGQPLQWNKVHDLPDYVYFNHSAHLAANVGCASCHGRVDQMPVVHQEKPLTMLWCVDCHRNPGPHLRPAGESVTNMAWEPKAELEDKPGPWVAANGRKVSPPTHCSGCHR